VDVAAADATARTADMPQAILLKDVEGVGEAGVVVDVSKGYLRNFLIPRKLAQPATAASIQQAQVRMAQLEKAKADAIERAKENAATLSRTVLTIAQQAGDDGRLFGSVTSQDIADAIKEARGLKVDRRKINLEEPIKHVGTYMVDVEMAEGATASVMTMVVEAK
jgi:large subunit ribosomal protein L9